ncbi:MAG TPA: helix-turn-helix transcriptional regulator [Sphingobium sp.]|uniref:response regulator transcription factor n=1 Tax=Sphingobium sp. TaxID=1912891 RepID=UPI002ED56120
MSATALQEAEVSLTTRELEVLALVAAGLSAKEIAQRIAIAPRTVERHIDNARLKLHARNRTHLVTCAIVTGLLSTGLQAELLLAHRYTMLNDTIGQMSAGQLATSI